MAIQPKKIKSFTIQQKLANLLGDKAQYFGNSFEKMSTADATVLYDLLKKPNLRLSVNRQEAIRRLAINTEFGSVILDPTHRKVADVYVNGTKFEPIDGHYEVLEELLYGNPANALTGNTKGRISVKREFRKENRKEFKIPDRVSRPNRPQRPTRSGQAKVETVQIEPEKEMTLADWQKEAYEQLKGTGLTYSNFMFELGNIISSNYRYDADTVMNELQANEVPEDKIAEYLIYGSEWKEEITGDILGRRLGRNQTSYKFQQIDKNYDPFLTRIMDAIGVEEAEYDPKRLALRVGDRMIYNLPKVDENGVFHGRNGTRYIPYHIGYFREGDGTRIERLRHIDPVQERIDAVALQWDMTISDVKFKSLTEVSRNLPDFDKHPIGKELLETYKRKVVLEKGLLQTNSLISYYNGNADDLGVVKSIMLDEDATGLIDPYGTSNGANFGAIFYLTKDAQFNPDGTFTKGEELHSELGEWMNNSQVAVDNMNRNQMSFNAALTSINVVKCKVAYAEFAQFNAEDAAILTKKGSIVMSSLHDKEEVFVDEFGDKYVKVIEEMQPMQQGDKIIDVHGDKSVSSIVVDPDMDPKEANEQMLTEAVKFVKNNPELDLIVSPVSINSRLNLGIVHEALAGEKQDLILNDGTVIKDGIVEMTYFVLPQTAEYKSKMYGEIDTYGDEVKGGRKFSTLYRNALSSKVGADLYEKAFLAEGEYEANVDAVNKTFERLGVSFKDPAKLVEPENVNRFVDANTTIHWEEFKGATGRAIRTRLNQDLEKYGTVNIDLGDMKITSPILKKPGKEGEMGEFEVIKDSQGRNVLPVRKVSMDEKQPFRNIDLYEAIARGKQDDLQKAYMRSVGADVSNLTEKENMLKNLKTTVKTKGAATQMIIPDPRLHPGEIRVNSNAEYIIAHRDPCLRSSNVATFKNVGGGNENLVSINPLIVVQFDADFDSDTMGWVAIDKLNLSEDEKQKFYKMSSIEEQVNKGGKVFLATESSHFKAMCNANNIDISDLNFKDGKSSKELLDKVTDVCRTIVKSPASYGAYAVSFTNERTALESLGRIADEGIKGKRADIERHFYEGYTDKENRDLMEALIAKSEWTGVAGAVTNKVISAIGDREFDPVVVRSALEVTHSLTQSVLQLKKNADQFEAINETIEVVSSILTGDNTSKAKREMLEQSTARQVLKTVTRDYLDEEIIDNFCNVVEERQKYLGYFGKGVLNNVELGTSQMAYFNQKNFIDNFSKIANGEITKQKVDKEKMDKFYEEIEKLTENNAKKLEKIAEQSAIDEANDINNYEIDEETQEMIDNFDEMLAETMRDAEMSM